MIKVPLNKDVGSYEAKFVGPFTLRQSLCILAAAPVCWGIYSGLTPILGGDIAGFLVLFPAALCWLIGWYKPYGMHTEKFIRSIFITTVLAPAHRKYKIRNRQTEMLAVLAASSTETNQHKKKTKYRISKEAVR